MNRIGEYRKGITMALTGVVILANNLGYHPDWLTSELVDAAAVLIGTAILIRIPNDPYTGGKK